MTDAADLRAYRVTEEILAHPRFIAAREAGASREGRGEWETVMQVLRGADEPPVLRLDRLGRSTRDESGPRTRRQGSLAARSRPKVTTTGERGHLVITVLGMVADRELKFIEDRRKAGIEAAKADGAYGGRKTRVNDDEIRRLAALGVGKAKIARDLKVSRMTDYRALEMVAARAVSDQGETPSSRAKRGDPTGSWEAEPLDRHASLAMTRKGFKLIGNGSSANRLAREWAGRFSRYRRRLANTATRSSRRPV
jgi:DNA invertase Pin-like site-specific DNA recombinase